MKKHSIKIWKQTHNNQLKPIQQIFKRNTYTHENLEEAKQKRSKT